jgi:hypothetical protein
MLLIMKIWLMNGSHTLSNENRLLGEEVVPVVRLENFHTSEGETKADFSLCDSPNML